MVVKSEVEFECETTIYFYDKYLYNLSGSDLTLYTYESQYDSIIKALVVDVDKVEIKEFKELTTISEQRMFAIDNVPYSVDRSSGGTLYKYDNNFNVIDQIELGDYHLSSITPDGMLLTTKLTENKKETDVITYDKDLKIHKEYKLGLWCSNVKMVNYSCIDCYRKSNEGRFSVMISKFAMLPPIYHYDTKTVRIEEYKIA